MAELKTYRNNRTYRITQIGRILDNPSNDNSLFSVCKQRLDERKKEEAERRRKFIESLYKG